MEIRMDYFLNSLPIAGRGVLSIFLVIGVIILAVTVLKKLDKK